MVANGQIPSSSLTYVQGIFARMYLLTPTAVAWKAMVKACKQATGVTLSITSPYGAYRSLKAQQKMWADRFNRIKYPAGVAYPGSSIHGFGRCVDVYNWGAAAEWLRDHADEYGFRRSIPTEAWHFEHSGGGSGGGVAPIPAQTTIEENNVNGLIYYAGETSKGVVITSSTASKTPAVTVTLPDGSSASVAPLSMYFQPRPGAPLVAFTDGKDYRQTVAGIEYQAFAQGEKYPRYVAKINELAALVALRGISG